MMKTAKEILDKIKAEEEEKKQNVEEKRKKEVDDAIAHLSDLSEMMYEKSLSAIRTNFDVRLASVVNEPEVREWLSKNGFALDSRYGFDSKYSMFCIKR